VYDHLLIFPPKSKGLGPALQPKVLLDFLKAEGNILLTLSATAGTPAAISSLLLEFDITLPADRNSLVVDHFNYDTLTASEAHDVVLVPRPDTLRPDVRNYFIGAGEGGEVIAFPRGVGQILGNTNPLLAPVLRAPRTAYAYNPKGEDADYAEDPFSVGKQMALVTAFQSRNNARLSVVGSAEMLEDKWLSSKVKRSLGEGVVGKGAQEKATDNRAFSIEIAGWTFQESGVIKVQNVEHYLTKDKGGYANETAGVKDLSVINPTMYRIKNDVVSSPYT
jgi:oligosaccharyltransferase complex subunit beta